MDMTMEVDVEKKASIAEKCVLVRNTPQGMSDSYLKSLFPKAKDLRRAKGSDFAWVILLESSIVSKQQLLEREKVLEDKSVVEICPCPACAIPDDWINADSPQSPPDHCARGNFAYDSTSRTSSDHNVGVFGSPETPPDHTNRDNPAFGSVRRAPPGHFGSPSPSKEGRWSSPGHERKPSPPRKEEPMSQDSNDEAMFGSGNVHPKPNVPPSDGQWPLHERPQFPGALPEHGQGFEHFPYHPPGFPRTPPPSYVEALSVGRQYGTQEQHNISPAAMATGSPQLWETIRESQESGYAKFNRQDTGNHGNNNAEAEDERTAWIKVSSIPDGVTEEELSLYFTNKRRDGGGDVSRINFDARQHVAFIEFAEAKAVQRVLNKCPLLMREKRITVEKFVPEKESAHTSSGDITEGCIIRVTGLAPNTDKELLTLYFENTKKSGGDDINKLEFAQDGSALITFADPQVARRVVEKTDLTLSSAHLTASLWQKPVPQDSKTIRVAGLKSSTSEEMLSLFFENAKKSGGGDIKEVVLREDGTALVTFEEEDIVHRVLSREDLQLEGRTLKVYLHEELVLECKTIHISGMVPNIAAEMVCLFFENEKKSGGGELEKIDLKSDGTAVITFQDVGVTNRVLEKDCLVLGGKRLTVSLWNPQMGADQQRGRQSADSPVIEDSIQVSGLTARISEDSLLYYFENKRRSSGGEIKNIKLDKEKGVAFITFVDPTVVPHVVEKHDHMVEKVCLEVVAHRPPPPIPSDPNKVFLEGIKPETTEECLKLYIENRCDLEPQRIITGEKPGTRMLIFDQPIDVNRLSESCRQKALEGSFLAVSSVPVSNCIRVTNFIAAITRDAIMYYFENNRKSGGGNTAKCIMFKDEGYCLVYFDDFKVISEVTMRKHSLGGQGLDVCVHYDCLGLVSIDGMEMPVVLPDPILVSDINSYLLDFFQSSPPNQQALNVEIQQVHGDVEWSTKRVPLKIHCSLTKDMKDIRKLIPGWKKSVLAGLKSFLQLFLVKEVACLQETWPKIKAWLQEDKTMDLKEGGILVMEDSQYKVVIAGHGARVGDCHKKVEEIKKSVEDELERQKKIIKEKKSLKHYQVMYLKAVQFPDTIMTKFQQLNVKLNYQHDEVEFTGLPKEITTAQLAMYEEMDKVKPNKMTVSPCIIELMQKSQTKKYLSEKLKQKSIQAVWDIQGSEVCVFAPTDKEIVEGTHIIKNSLAESVVPIKAESVPILTSSIWMSKVQELEERYAGVLKIIPASDNLLITIVAIDDIVKSVLELVNDFLKANTILTEFSQLDLGTAQFIEKYKLNEIRTLEKSLQMYKVEIQMAGSGDKPGISVKGTEDGVYQVKQKLEQLTGAVKSRRYHINKPGIPKYLLSSKGNEYISTVEQKCFCTIREASKQDSTGGSEDFVMVDNSSGAPRIRASVSLPKNRKILAVVADMTEYRVDAIVNAANGDLNHAGGLAGAIVKKGGNSIQKESDHYVKSKGRIKDGEVAITGAGSLPCKAIIHAVGPVWKGGGRSEEDYLQEAVMNSLDVASDKGFTSIAIPAISTGVFGYPMTDAVQTIVDSVKYYFKEEPASSLREVHLIDVSEQTVQQFITVLINIYGKQDVTMLAENPTQPFPLRANLRWKKTRSSSQYFYSVPDESDMSRGHRKSGGILRTRAGIQICLVKGELAKQKADVLVNTTSKELALKNGAVSASLVRAAGQQMQVEVQQSYPNGLTNYGQVAVTNGYKLQCKKVFHGSLPGWDGGPAKEVLVQFVQACLASAQGSGFSSISIPAMGTGNLKFPKPVVAKAMYDAVMTFGNTSRCIKTVNFIVFPGDSSAVQAFETEHGKRTGSSSGGPSSRRKGRTFQRTSANQGTGASGPAVRKHVFEDDIFPLGDVFLKVMQGDITNESADAIVNSTNSDLDLKLGEVAKAILRKAGKEILTACKKQVDTIRKEGLAVTSSGDLKCRMILHLDAGTTDSWKKKMIKCLFKANELKLTSLAFPALGTGQRQNSASKMADDIFSAIMEFQSKLKDRLYLTDIRLVVFQLDMVTDVKIELAKCYEKQGGKSKSIFGRVYGTVAGWLVGSEEEGAVGGLDQPKIAKSIALVIISDNDRSIDQAIEKLDEMCKSESEDKFVTKPWSETINNLTDEQVARIYASENQQGVKLTVEKEIGSIRIQGMPADVMATYEKLTTIFKEVQDDLHSIREAEVYANLIQWYFMEEDESAQMAATLTKYDPTINKRIEDAFQKKNPCTFLDDASCKYICDFDSMTEYPEKYPEDAVKLVRKTQITGSGGFEPPPCWKTMDDTVNLEVVPLLPTDSEYQTVVNNLHTQMAANVIKVERIQNRSLYEQYLAHKGKMERGSSGTTIEKTLWHGTSAETVPSINSYGFNRSYCGKNATMFGNGVYFAVNATYSASATYARPDIQGHKRMYLTKVLIGAFTQGRQGMIVPPAKSGHILYDSVVDNPSTPGMYIIFHDTQAYPEYLVTFT